MAYHLLKMEYYEKCDRVILFIPLLLILLKRFRKKHKLFYEKKLLHRCFVYLFVFYVL